MSREQNSPPSIPSLASPPSFSSCASGSAAHWPSRHAPSLEPHDRWGRGVQEVTSLSTTAALNYAPAPIPELSDRASLAAEERHVPAEDSPDAKGPSARYSPSRALPLVSSSHAGDEEVTGSRQRSERASRLVCFKSNSGTLLSPPEHSSTSESGVGLLLQPPHLSTPPTTCVSQQQQQQLQRPSRSLESVGFTSLTSPVAPQEPLGVASPAFALTCDDYGPGETLANDDSSWHLSNPRRLALSDMGDSDGRASRSPGISEANGARPPSQALEAQHRSLCLGQSLEHTCYNSLGGSDDKVLRRPGGAQRTEETQQARGLSEASLTSSMQLSTQSILEEAGWDCITQDGQSGAEPRPPRGGTFFSVPGRPGSRLPMGMSMDGTVRCDRRGGAAAVVVKGPPPLPQAPQRAIDGTAFLNLSPPGRHSPTKRGVGDVDAVTHPYAASEANEITEARASSSAVPVSRECGWFNATLPPKGDVVPALGLDDAHRGSLRSIDHPQRGQPPQLQPPQQALHRWRSRASLVSGAAAKAVAVAFSGRVVTHDTRRTASQKKIERDGHLSEPRRAADHTATCLFKGDVHSIPWVPGSVGRGTDPPGVSLSPQFTRDALPWARAGVCATGLRTASTVERFGSGESPRVVAAPLVARPYRAPPHEMATSSVPAEVVKGCAVKARVPEAKGRSAQAISREAVLVSTLSPRVHMRLSMITSPRNARVLSSAERVLAMGGASQIDWPDRSSDTPKCKDGSTGGGFRLRSGDMHRIDSAAAVQQADLLQGSSNEQRASRSRLVAVLAPRDVCKSSSANREEGGDAGDDQKARKKACLWRTVTLHDLVCGDDVTVHDTPNDPQCTGGASVASRPGQGPRHSQTYSPTLQNSTVIVDALSVRPQTGPTNDFRDFHDRALSIQASPLVPSVSSTVAIASDVGLRAHQAHNVVTRRSDVASTDGGGSLFHSALEPGYAAVYSPCIRATRVLETREAILKSDRAVAVNKGPTFSPPGSPSALPLHYDTRTAPVATAATATAAAGVVVAPSSSDVVWSRFRSSLQSPLHLYVDLTERNANEGVLPAASADIAPLSLCLSGSPCSEAPRRHSAALFHPHGRGLEDLHERPAFPIPTSPHPVARRIPFGFAAGALSNKKLAPTASTSPEAESRAPVLGRTPKHPQSGDQYARKTPLRTPDDPPRSTTASPHDGSIKARAVAAPVDAPSQPQPASPPPTAAASPALRATSMSTLQARRRRPPSPEHHATESVPGRGTETTERVRHTSATRTETRVKDAGESGDVPALRKPRLSHTIAQQRLIKEEGFRRRQIGMQEDHCFAVEMAELNYKRAVDSAHQASNALALDQLKVIPAAPMTTDSHSRTAGGSWAGALRPGGHGGDAEEAVI
ncbi:hypothetical protein JKF63_04396 [Porcisia hertigi]|uniref:5'a2rel-related protein n=1 Tax=Porcisia hertigi TaxID=2761500 RepID=A0A836LAQ5_9TRYP|nr:hypothetical protein JKF63_04396 [Porcisia hertigi]